MKSKILWWPFLRQHWVIATLIILLGLAAGYWTLLLPLSIGKFFEISFNDGNTKTRALQLLGIRLPGNINSFFIFFTGVMFAKFLCSWGYNYLTSLLGDSFVFQLRRQFLKYKLAQLPVKGKLINADLLMTFSSDVKSMQQLLVKGVLGLVKDVLFLVMALYVLFSLQALLTVAVTLFIILFYCIQYRVNLFNKPLAARKRKKQAGLFNHVTKMFENDGTAENDAEKMYEKKAASLFKAQKHYHAATALLKAATPLALYLVLAGMLFFLHVIIGPERLQPSDIFVFILLLLTLFPVIRDIIRSSNTWVPGGLAASKFIRAKEFFAGIADKNETLKMENSTNTSYSLLQFDRDGNNK